MQRFEILRHASYYMITYIQSEYRACDKVKQYESFKGKCSYVFKKKEQMRTKRATYCLPAVYRMRVLLARQYGIIPLERMPPARVLLCRGRPTYRLSITSCL